MGCQTSSPSQPPLPVQMMRRKSSHVITGNELNNSNNALPRTFVASEVSELLHDSIEKRNEDTVIRVLSMYKSEDYEDLMRYFMEEYCIDPVTLAFQNLSINTSEFVRLRLTAPIKNVCHYINFHLRDKNPNFQNRILGVILGYQEIELREMTRSYFQSYGYTLSDHLYGGFEGEVLDFLKDMLNRNTDSDVFEENSRHELDVEQERSNASVVLPHGRRSITRKIDDYRFSNGSITAIPRRKSLLPICPDFVFETDGLLDLEVKDYVEKLHSACISNNLTEGDQFIFKLLATQTRQNLREIFECFVQKYHRDIVVDIEKSAPQSYLRDLLVLSVQILRNDSLYFANEINRLLKSTDEDSAKNYYLMFYLMTRSEDCLNQIKKAYRNHYFQSLSEDIRSLITEPVFQNILIKALTGVS